MERYQAEALIYQHLPINGLIGIVCYTEKLKQDIEQLTRACGLSLQVETRTQWYFE
jgi:hypothetical protein